MRRRCRGDRRVQVIVDSCHAGTMTRSQALPAADPAHARTLGLSRPVAGLNGTERSSATGVSPIRSSSSGEACGGVSGAFMLSSPASAL